MTAGAIRRMLPIRHPGALVLSLVIGAPTLAMAQPRTVVAAVAGRGAEAEASTGFCWDAHPCIRIGGVLTLSGFADIQLDGWRSQVPYPETADILLRDVARRRLGFSARVARIVDVFVEREFGAGTDPWRDRYVNVGPIEAVQVRAGSFKLPFSADENARPDELRFILHTQSATLLAPGRDTGVMLHGSVGRRFLGYELGVFDHDGRNARTSDTNRVYGDRTVAGRFTVRPWQLPATKFGSLRASVAFTSSKIPEGYPSLNARTALDVPYYSSKVYVNGHQRRLGAEMEWRARPCSASAEYLRMTDERIGESVEDTDLSPFIGAGWHVSGTCGVFGQERTTGAPARNTLLPGSDVGFVEVGLRFEHLRFGSVATGDEPSTSPRADVIPGNGSGILTMVVNWHVNRWVRLQVNAIREALSHPESGPFPDQPHFWSGSVRLHFLL
jgi:phosphate-selective porin